MTWLAGATQRGAPSQRQVAYRPGQSRAGRAGQGAQHRMGRRESTKGGLRPSEPSEVLPGEETMNSSLWVLIGGW